MLILSKAKENEEERIRLKMLAVKLMAKNADKEIDYSEELSAMVDFILK